MRGLVIGAALTHVACSTCPPPVVRAPASSDRGDDGACGASELCAEARREVRADIGPAMIQQPAPVEIAPSVHAALGARFEPDRTRAVASFGAELETTFPVATLFPHSIWRLPDGEAAPLARDPA